MSYLDFAVGKRIMQYIKQNSCKSFFNFFLDFHHQDDEVTPGSERLPKIHFIIHEDKVALRVKQNTTDLKRHYKRKFLFQLPCYEKIFVPGNTKLVWLFFLPFF